MSWREKWLRWLGQGSSHVESNAPKGWYIKGFAIALLIMIPVGLWVVGHGSGERGKGVWTLRACPPVSPIPRAELAEHPLRFRGRFLWIVGRVRVARKRCLSLPCEPGRRCCQPCQARLTIGAPPHQFVLSGLLRHQTHPRVACRGTSCKLSCGPFVPGRVYAVAGTPRLAQVTQGRDRQALGRPSFRVRSFQIHQFCPLRVALPLYQRRRLPEPRSRRRPKKGTIPTR